MQLDVKEVASHLDVSEREVYHWISRNEIPCFRVNDRYRFNGAEVLEWAAARHMRLHPHILSGDAALDISVSEAMDNGGIFHNLESHDRESFLHKIMDLIPLPVHTDREYAIQMICGKPDLGLVCLGDGILGPHVRHPMVLDVGVPVLILCFSAASMPFNISENGGYTAVFFLVSNDVHTHQRIVSKLAFLLEDEELRRLLINRASASDILEAFTRTENELLK